MTESELEVINNTKQISCNLPLGFLVFDNGGSLIVLYQQPMNKLRQQSLYSMNIGGIR